MHALTLSSLLRTESEEIWRWGKRYIETPSTILRILRIYLREEGHLSMIITRYLGLSDQGIVNRLLKGSLLGSENVLEE